jgi:hypothetical protein
MIFRAGSRPPTAPPCRTREGLMLMETKLDLVEAAIRILDARTREGAVSG